MPTTLNRIVLLVLLAALVGLTAWLNGQARAETAAIASPNWSAPKLLSETSASGAYNPRLSVAANGVILVAYNHKFQNGTHDPYYRRSSDHGLTWSAPAPIHSSSGVDSVQVAIVQDGSGTGHAVWVEGNVLVYARQDEWANSYHTIANGGSHLILNPSLALGPDGSIHVAWSETTDSSIRQILYARSQNGGATWSSAVALADNQNDSQSSSLAVDASGNIHAVWEEPSLIVNPPDPPVSQAEIHYRKGTVSGNTVSWAPATSQPAQVLSGGAGVVKARRPTIIASGNNLHLSFASEASSTEQYAYYSNYTPAGGWSTPTDTTLGNPVSVNTADPFFLVTTLAYCNNTAYVYYHGTYVSSENEHIWGARSEANWVPQDKVTAGTNRSINPSLGCNSNNNMLHLVYERIEVSTSAHQIYYTRGLPHIAILPVIHK